MITKENYPISSISWLASLHGDGVAKTFFEPETLEELKDLCYSFYLNKVDFDLIGHTSNTLYSPDYVCERMVSTRRLNNFIINSDYIWCECGTSVKALSLAAIDAGIEGFEGTIDLPGTVASALYGHSTCFGCDLSALLKEATVLTDDGELITVGPEWFSFNRRSSSLKRKEKRAVILSVTLMGKKGDKAALKSIAEKNHVRRCATQPEAKNSLGSVFHDSNKPTVLNRLLYFITKPYSILLTLLGEDEKDVKRKRNHVILVLLRAADIEPYVRSWNWYQWTDEKSYELFWKYIRVHKKMFTNSELEIEIKQNKIDGRR